MAKNVNLTIVSQTNLNYVIYKCLFFGLFFTSLDAFTKMRLANSMKLMWPYLSLNKIYQARNYFSLYMQLQQLTRYRQTCVRARARTHTHNNYTVLSLANSALRIQYTLYRLLLSMTPLIQSQTVFLYWAATWLCFFCRNVSESNSKFTHSW